MIMFNVPNANSQPQMPVSIKNAQGILIQNPQQMTQPIPVFLQSPSGYLSVTTFLSRWKTPNGPSVPLNEYASPNAITAVVM